MKSTLKRLINQALATRGWQLTPLAGDAALADLSEADRAIVKTVDPFTLTGLDRRASLLQAVDHIVRHGVPGDIVECGVWRGGSMMAVAKTLLSTGDSERHLHLYDTYEGMSEPTEHDKRYDGRAAADMMAVTNKDNPIWAYASLDDVQEGMRETGFPSDRIHYYKGRVEETIPQQAPPQISILRLDTDWYESTKHELEHLYPLLVPGGVLILDDYGWWQGCRKAVEEFLADTKFPLLMLRTDEGRIAVKPPESFDWAR